MLQGNITAPTAFHGGGKAGSSIASDVATRQSKIDAPD
jgi:hypothetical protein